MSDQQAASLEVRIELPGQDAARADRAFRVLRKEILRDVPVQQIGFERAGPAPQHAKGFDAYAVAVLATVAPMALAELLKCIRAWITRGERLTVRVRVQTESGAALEVEVPSTMTDREIQHYVSLVLDLVPADKRDKQT